MLFVFSRDGGKENMQVMSLVKKYEDILESKTITFSIETKILFEKFGIKNEGCYLVRPDSYIAWRSQGQDEKKLEQYLERFLAF